MAPHPGNTPLPTAAVLFDHLADAVYLVDPQSSAIVWCNRAAWTALGLSRDEVLDQSLLSLQLDIVGLPQWTEIAAAVRAGTCHTFVGRHRHHDGHEVHVEMNTTCFTHGGCEYFLAVVRDVGRRLALDRSQRDRESQLTFALNEAADGLWDWELATGEVFFSPQLQRMLGYGPGEMTPLLATWADNVHPDDSSRVMRNLFAHLDGRLVRYEAEYRLRNRNGQYLWVHDRGKVCERDAGGQPTRVVGMVQDITERKTLELRLQELAWHDALTGLPNRRRGEEFIDNNLALCERAGLPMGVCFCDLDHFKAFNDTYGHLTGDRVLRRVASAVSGVLRKSDLLFRWGGEEFVIACPNADMAQMQRIARKVREALDEVPWQAALGVAPVTMSIGIAVFREHGHDRGSLIASADRALYRAKGAGRDRVELALPVPGAHEAVADA